MYACSCMHVPRMCVCICTSVHVHFLTAHPVAYTVRMCKRSALNYCSMFVCTCMCACPSVYFVCILYSPFLVSMYVHSLETACSILLRYISKVR